ncbi:hypothetical protein Ae201684P_012178 [Aphanomyces euteiches]|nr:hypothetical protein Ae201684P_012178 [Aphanomyces euteiches]
MTSSKTSIAFLLNNDTVVHAQPLVRRCKTDGCNNYSCTLPAKAFAFAMGSLSLWNDWMSCRGKVLRSLLAARRFQALQCCKLHERFQVFWFLLDPRRREAMCPT